MKNIFIIIGIFFFSLCYSQEKKLYIFYVELNHYTNAPEFEGRNGNLNYHGSDINEKTFFSNYSILDFFQVFPDSKRERTLNVFEVVTYSKSLMNDMIKQFPDKYLMVEDISDLKVELVSTYPNDYGSTSPVTNLGINASFKNLDYVNAPKAWDYTFGSSKVIIGISDAKVDTTDVDLKFKTTIISPSDYQSLPYDPNDIYTSHGTTVASIAAAQGNNSHGMTGICSECSIIATGLGYGSPGGYENPTPNYNSLLQLAIAGAKVINMSWIQFSTTSTTPLTIYQWVIDEIHEDYNVVMVAGSGNTNSWELSPTGTLYYYPASHNHVISVLTVNHRNTWNEEVNNDYPEWGPISRFVEDMISPSVVANYQGNGPYGFYAAHTTNDRVDICAPGYRLLEYGRYVGNGAIEYMEFGGTSSAAPHVSGTVGLMLSVNECLLSDEVEDILQLTSKNLEVIQGNEIFRGYSGSGKLETGDAVEFVYEMKQLDGNAVIEGQDFYRFNFNLKHINNKLTVSDQIFRDKCTADFTARNIIDILPGSDFKPNATGFVDFKINASIDVSCSLPRSVVKADIEKNERSNLTNHITKLYPNPNNGNFEITLGTKANNEVNIEVYNVLGKIVYEGKVNSLTFGIDISNISSGMYIVKLSYNNTVESLKFVKQ